MSIAVPNEWASLKRAIAGDAALVPVLQREGIDVIPSELQSVRDGLFAVGSHLVAASMRSKARRGEPTRLLLRVATAETRTMSLTVPPGADNEVDGAFLEGGDVLVTDTEVYVGMSGQASNMEGIDWLTAQLGGDRRVIPIAMRSSVRHLEDVLALVRPGLLVQSPGLLVDGLPRALRDWQSIDLRDGETADLMVLGPGRVLVSPNEPRLEHQLRQAGLEVEVLALATLPLGVGLRAAHAALNRE